MTKLQMKWAGVGLLVTLALYLLYPSMNWYSMSAKHRDRAGRADRPKILLNLGLDLKGGSHLLYELDVEALPPDEKVSDGIDRAIEVIRNRVDELGVAEPLIARQGTRWIVVQLPGIKNSKEAKKLIGGTALLEFRMLDESDAAADSRSKINELGKSVFVADPVSGLRVPTQEAKALVPEGSRLFRARGSDAGFFILKDVVRITGALLENARVDTGQNGLPVVAFTWKPEGGKIFWDLTSASVGKRMAIVLDGQVQSAPRINGPIRESGEIEGNFSMSEARNLAIVLRAGALPAPMRNIEERTVGASLGEDSIRQGLTAVAIGGILVLVFMLVYYRIAGIFADIAMTLNLLFVLGMMAYFGATLTLPGIAGILLTVGMAIDANVLIFERIREELTLGKPIRIAVDSGYDKAFSAIIDSNITTLVAATFLFQFGTGPIKGFALTLTLGIMCSMFTAIVVTRMMFEAYLSSGTVEELSI